MKHWEVHIPGDETGAQPQSVAVAAENWFSALRGALARSDMGGSLVSSLTCDIKPDGAVHVTDFVTRKVFVLRPLAEPAPEPPPAASVAAPAAEQPRVTEPALPQDLPPHEAFFWRDEAPADGSGIFHRERLLAVDPSVSVEDAGRLALAVFERLRALGAAEDTKLFVTVQVFDHAFEHRSLRPPVAALAWKEWSPRKGRVEFPLSGAPGVPIGHLPRTSYPPVGAPPDATLPPPAGIFPDQPPPAPQEQPVDLIPRPVTAVERPVDLIPLSPAPPSAFAPAPVAPAPVAPAPEPIQAQAAPPAPEPIQARAAPPAPEPRPAPRPASAPGRRPTPSPLAAVDAGIEDKVVHAFERMHDLYSIRDHDAAARFALDLSREFVDCEAGSAMLITPGKYELYIAAAAGPVAEQLLGRRMSLTKGIIGFATRAGAVITVSDPASDPRFHEEFDTLSGFVTRNVACAPIQHEGRTIGALELINSRRPAGFLQAEANVLSYIAGAVGEYMDTSLPSREADFSDKEFLEFLPAKRSRPPGSKAPAAPGKKAAPAATAPAAAAPVAARKPLPGAGPSQGKKKRKR